MGINQSNLPTIQRLKFEDYSRAETWQDAFEGLVESLNLFIAPVYDILNGGVDSQNVIAPQIYAKTVTGATVTTFTFINPLRITPRAVLLGNIWTGIPSRHPATAQVFWHISNNAIIVDDVPGLVAGTIYNLVLVIL